MRSEESAPSAARYPRLVASADSSRWLPRIHKSPTTEMACSATRVRHPRPSDFDERSPQDSRSFVQVEAVSDRSKSRSFNSDNSEPATKSSPQSAQLTLRFTSSRNAFTCAGVHSSHRTTGISVSPSFRAPSTASAPSTTSPVLRRQNWILKRIHGYCCTSGPQRHRSCAGCGRRAPTINVPSLDFSLHI